MRQLNKNEHFINTEIWYCDRQKSKALKMQNSDYKKTSGESETDMIHTLSYSNPLDLSVLQSVTRK